MFYGTAREGNAGINLTGDTFSVEKIVQFFQGHPEMDRAFHWELKWVAGRK